MKQIRLTPDELREAIVRATSESEFQKQVIDFARANGWLVAHFRPAMTKRGNWVTPVAGDAKGFPDLVMVKDTRLVLAELKAEGRRPTPEQTKWLTALHKTSAEVYVWKPSDFFVIEDILTDNVLAGLGEEVEGEG